MIFIKCFNSLNEIYYFYDYNIDFITMMIIKNL